MSQYRIIAGLTIGAVVLLIFVGGVVRMTGSGMGCPDWPTCFGQWIPPTDISELPADYKTQFQVQGKEIADFDPFKTWVEYLNRLLGVLIGLFAIATAIAGFRLKGKTFSRLRIFSGLGLALVIIQGGIGAYVVRTDLHTGVVTLHMLIAILIVAVLIAGFLSSYPDQTIPSLPKQLKGLGIGLLVLTLVQIIFGTQVREAVDTVAIELGEGARGQWLAEIGSTYQIHRYFYYAVVGGLLVFSLRLRPYLDRLPGAKVLIISLLGLVLTEILIGIGMHHFSIPPVLQPLHLMLATMIFSLEFALIGSWWVWGGNETSASLIQVEDLEKPLAPSFVKMEHS
ncbi:MAG: COX15/CtaA family protein [Bacteroidota bacterium]